MTAPSPATVEEVVRGRLAESLGGRRGMLEAGLPTLLFTLVYLVGHELRPALIASAAVAAAALALRLVQRSTVQYVVNAAVGIAIGWIAVRSTAAGGGDEREQALAFFVPGIVITAVYTLGLIVSCLVSWPALGFLVGTVTGDTLAWHEDAPVVRLLTRLTWLFLAPGGILVVLEAPVALLGLSGAMDRDTAVFLLGIARLAIGWPLRVLFWGAMAWVLARGRTPIAGETEG